MTLQKQLRFWLLGLLGFMGVLWVFKPVLTPFVSGLAIAYLLDPMVDKLEEWKLPRSLAAALALLSFIIFILLIFVLLLPIVSAQVMALIQAIPEWNAQFREQTVPAIQLLLERVGASDYLDIESYLLSYSRNISSWLTGLAGEAVDISLALFEFLGFITIMPIVAFYILRDYDRLIALIDSWLPRDHAATIRDLISQMNKATAGFIRGQIMVASILAVVYAAALSIAGLHFGVLIGLVAGLLSVIPYVGLALGFIISVLMAFAQFGGFTMPLIVAAIFIGGQMIEGQFLTPKLVGEQTGLHAVWVIFGILAGGSIFGFAGVLIGVPFVAVMAVLARFLLRQYLSSRYYLGMHGGELPLGDVDDFTAEVQDRDGNGGQSGDDSATNPT